MCRRALGVLTWLACGCGDSVPATVGPGQPPTDPCGAGELLLEDGACLPAGLQANGCAAGQALGEDGACIAAGIAPGGCGAGFEAADSGGCDALLPPRPCPKGQMAVPGERSCHEVAPCAGPPAEASVFVDATYAGADSDGTPAKPWTRIQDAVDAAAAGSTIAIAAGTYTEDVVVDGKKLVLWGACPADVAIVGSPGATAALRILGSSGTEVHALAIAGTEQGAEIHDSEEVIFDRVWIHDTGYRGIVVDASEGPAGATLSHCLVEETVRLGLWSLGGEVTIDGGVVRGTKPSSDGNFGDGVFAEEESDSLRRGKLHVRGSLVERNTKVGIFVGGSEALIEDTLVRDTLLGADQIGRGIQVQTHGITHERASAVVSRSVVERGIGCGICVYGSDLSLDASVVRDTLAATDEGGRGINVQPDPETGERAAVEVRSSLVERSREMGIYIAGSDATVVASHVRDTAPSTSGFGRGINVQLEPTLGARGSLVVTSSRIERSVEVGIFVDASDATIDGTLVRDTALGPVTHAGRGIGIQVDPASGLGSKATVRSSIVDTGVEVGIAVLAAEATIEATLVQGTAATPADEFGDGITVASEPGFPAEAVLRGVRITGSARAGVSSFGSPVGIERSALFCNAIAIDGEQSAGAAFAFEDLGVNACGCGAKRVDCIALTSNLAAPAAIEGVVSRP